MNARLSLAERVEQYLAERRRLGFELRPNGATLKRFARYVEALGHRGPVTMEVMTAWARQVKKGRGDRATAARALRTLRPFMRWLQHFEPATEVPDEAVFGTVPARLAPHIFRDEEIEALLKAAGDIGPPLRSAVMQTLFGLIACTGLRISEALQLVDSDVDLNSGVLSVRGSKFGKTRLVALHPSAVAALCAYRRERSKYVPADPEGPFFIATRGRRLGQPVSERQAHRVFDQLRQQLGWMPRGGHGTVRIHDLRHSFAVRCLVRWHEQGENVHRHMLALSTYMGHAKVSNTYWYLTGVAELLQLVGSRFEHFADHGDVEENADG
jgi:integrase